MFLRCLLAACGHMHRAQLSSGMLVCAERRAKGRQDLTAELWSGVQVRGRLLARPAGHQGRQAQGLGTL